MNATVKTYFDAFNAGDVDGMLACLSEDVAHHVNEGQIRGGQGTVRRVLCPYEPLLTKRT